MGGMLGGGILRSERVMSAESPSKRLQSGLFHGFTNNVTFVQFDQGMSSRQNESCLSVNISHRADLCVGAIWPSLNSGSSKRETSNPVNDEIFSGKSSGLVKAG